MRAPTNSPSSATRVEVQPGLWLDSRRALWMAATGLLLVSDLHWGFALAHRARGNLLPRWGDEEISNRLQALLADYQPREMIWLGDIVHAAEGAAAAEAFLRACAVPVTLIGGNHDRRWKPDLPRIQRRGRHVFHHGDAVLSKPDGCVEVIGHHHPSITWSDGAGAVLKLPSLVCSSEQIVLPAFSPWAAGAGCNPLLGASSSIWAITPNRIFAVEKTRFAAAI